MVKVQKLLNTGLLAGLQLGCPRDSKLSNRKWDPATVLTFLVITNSQQVTCLNYGANFEPAQKIKNFQKMSS